jgi:hypothetical protein
MPRLKLITAVRVPPHAILRTYMHPVHGKVQVPTFSGEWFGGGGDVIWIKPLCTILKFCAPPDPRPPRAPRGGDEAA